MRPETTEEFASRFAVAVEGHPLAPPTQHGRQRWVREKLIKEANLTVSPNTMSKWFHGTARPRPDNVRKIARVLKVDEVWLSMGQEPTSNNAVAGVAAEAARGAVLVFAGLIEMAGGRVAFTSKDHRPTDLHVNINGQKFGAIIVTLSEQGDKLSAVVPEPVGEARVFAVVRDASATMSSLLVYDLTAVPRESLGGFSIVQMDKDQANRLISSGTSGPIAPLDKITSIAMPT